MGTMTGRTGGTTLDRAEFTDGPKAGERVMERRVARRGCVWLDGEWRCKSCLTVIPEGDTECSGTASYKLMELVVERDMRNGEEEEVDEEWLNEVVGYADGGPERCRRKVGKWSYDVERRNALRRDRCRELAEHPAVPDYVRRWALKRVKRGRGVAVVYRVLRTTIEHYRTTGNVRPPAEKHPKGSEAALRDRNPLTSLSRVSPRKPKAWSEHGLSLLRGQAPAGKPKAGSRGARARRAG